MGVGFSGADRRGEEGAMVCEIRKLKLLGCHSGATWLLGLAGTTFDHQNVGSRSGEEDEDKRPDLEGLIGGWTRYVSSAIWESCSVPDAV